MSPSPQAIYLDEKSDQQTALPTHNDPEPTPVPRRSRCVRRFRIFCAILFTWLAFVLVRDHRRNRPPSFVRLGPAFSVMYLPIPPDVTLEDCAGWEGDSRLQGRHFATAREPFTAFASFELPISSEKLFFLARGMASGSVKLRYGSDSDNVKVAVEARYRLQEAIDSVKVCTITRDDGENGLGIFGAEWSRRNAVSFTATLYLPKPKDGSVLQVKSFETDAPLFVHDIGDLERFVHFDNFKLKTANTPISVTSLGAENAVVETRNSPVSGSFNVTSSLKLQTSNAHINVIVNLHNDDEKAVTDLSMYTSNSGIKGVLTLESAKETGGKFQVSGSTSNAPLDLVVSEAPVDSVLLLDAHTSLAPARVELHKTFEGTFSVATSLKRPDVIFDGDVEDPARKERKRKIDVRVVGGVVSGSTWWSGNEEGLLGKVSIHTSLSPATLKL
ncbi:hypothetical protein FPV67DRAFT_506362 [Lyophyllum atratum]|nr:hypothetical protein FPV67DRAFT_506362 [Lyophyllum atratum]